MLERVERPTVGEQEPRLCTRAEYDDLSAGDEACQLAEQAGVLLDPWQQFLVRLILARNRNRWAALRVGYLVARQNGKGEVLLALTLYWLFLSDPKRDRLITHTAHEFKTSSEAFLRLKSVIDANDWMSARVKGVPRTSHGEEGYAMRNGVRLRFLARSLHSGRGFTGDKIILDEAQQLPTYAMDALMPTLSARPDPQLVICGTVPSERNDAKYWTGIRDKGRKGTTPRMSWAEWNIGERVPKAALYTGDDPALVAKAMHAWDMAVVAANPGIGHREGLGWDFFDAEREDLSFGGWVREVCNIWSSEPPGMVIPLHRWLDLTQEGSTLEGRFAVALDCPPGLDRTVITAMGRNKFGQWHGEVVERHEGVQWVPVRLAELVRKNGDVAAVVVDPGSPAGALIPDIEAEGVEVMRVTPQQHAAACGMLYSRAMQDGKDDDGNVLDDPWEQADGPMRQLVHLGDPILSDALKAATKRPGPDGAWLWNRKDSGDDISPLVALTLAGYGLSTLPAPVDDPWALWT